MDEQNNTPGVPQAPETDQLRETDTNPVPAENAPEQRQPEQPKEGEEAPVDYNFLSDEDIEPKGVEKPKIDEDMTEEEIEKANQDYEIKKSSHRSKVSEIKADIVDFLSDTENPDIFKEYRKDVEKVAQLDGAEKFTTEGLFFLVGGKQLVNDLVQRSVKQIQAIDNNNRSNKKPNSPPNEAPDGMPDFLNMTNEEFRKYKAQVTSGAIVM